MNLKRNTDGLLTLYAGAKSPGAEYAKDGKLKFWYNFFGMKQYMTEGTKQLPAETHQVRMEFTYDGGGLAKGGTVTLYVDGVKAGEGRVEMTHPVGFSMDETCDIGDEFGSPVTHDYQARRKFSGEVNWVEIKVITKQKINLKRSTIHRGAPRAAGDHRLARRRADPDGA